MSLYGGTPYDPYNGPPPPDDPYQGDGQVIDAEVLNSWMSAADAREWRIFEEIEVVLKQMELNGWRFRAKLIRKHLRHLRKQAADMGYEWGKEDHG